jgi:GNAT superfamily N-acetyltransferase
MDPRIIVRAYNAARDAASLRACIIAQQDHHRSLEHTWPEGSAIVNDYVTYLETECAARNGCILIAECDGHVAGFACAVASTRGDSPDDPDMQAWVHDVFVTAEHRRRGVATMLMAEVEAFARSQGARTVRLGVLARNETACAFYVARGFRDYTRVLTKPLA